MASGEETGRELEPVTEASGELEVRIVDHFDGTVEHRYILHAEGDPPRRWRLAFSQDPELPPGTRLTVFGTSAGKDLRVWRYVPRFVPRDDLAEIERAERALIDAPPFPKRRVAFVLVDLGAGVRYTPAEARLRVFGEKPADESMRQTLLEYSFGRQDIEGEIVGPLKATMDGCDEDEVGEQLRAEIPGAFDNYAFMFGRRVPACGWAGVASLGRVGRPARELYLNGTAACPVATHEFGHNLGLVHSGRFTCQGGIFSDNPDEDCRSSEYGDSRDIMGDGCNHVNGYSKAYLKWFEGCNGVHVKKTGTYTLYPTETPCNGPQVLLVPMPKARRYRNADLTTYIVELRAPLGLDANHGPEIQLRVGDDIDHMRSGRRTFVLDANGSASGIGGFRAGDSFTDPAGGLTLTVKALGAASATVEVTMAAGMGAGEATCLDGSPLPNPAPTCGVGAPPPQNPPSGGNPPVDAGASAPPDAGGEEEPTRPAPDAAPGRNGGAGGAAGGSNPTAGSSGGRENPSSGGGGGSGEPAGATEVTPAGCGCRLGADPGNAPSSGAPLVLLAGMVLGIARGRVRRRGPARRI